MSNEKMESTEKSRVTYTKDMLIKDIARECFGDRNVVRSIYETLESRIFELLSSADESNDISIRLFEGISLHSTFVPERDKVNNLRSDDSHLVPGEVITVKSRIAPTARITRSYQKKLTEHGVQ